MAAAKQYSDAMIRSLQEQVESLKTQHAQSTALSSEVASKEMAAVRKELSAAVEKCGSLQSMLDDRTTHLTEAQTQIAVLHERLASSNATATSTASELQRIVRVLFTCVCVCVAVFGLSTLDAAVWLACHIHTTDGGVCTVPDASGSERYAG